MAQVTTGKNSWVEYCECVLLDCIRQGKERFVKLLPLSTYLGVLPAIKTETVSGEYEGTYLLTLPSRIIVCLSRAWREIKLQYV